MTRVFQAVDTDEPFHDNDFEDLASQGLYGTISGCALTYDAANMTVDIAAGSILHNGTIVTVAAATDAVTLVSDGSNERWTAIHVNGSGTVAITSGDPAADGSTEPTKPEVGDVVVLAWVKIQAAQTIANNCEYKLDKRVMTWQEPIHAAALQLVESGTHKAFFALGPGSTNTTLGTAYNAGNISVGLGFTALGYTGAAGSQAITQDTDGSWKLTVGNADGVGFRSIQVPYTADWTLVFRMKASSTATRNVFFGAKATSTSYNDESNLIGFRISGAANVIGVCDSGGTESTVDTSADATTEATYRIEVRSAGTIVRFFKNNVQVESDITTNIPTGNLYIMCGEHATAAVAPTVNIYDCFGWREV